MYKSDKWLLEYLTKQLKDTESKLVKHILSVEEIPNPLYMEEDNQRETMWSDKDNETYSKLDLRKNWLHKQIEKLTKNK
jgi:hypothetical protein